MKLQNTLKQATFNIFSLIRGLKKKQITNDLDKILKDDYDELVKNETYSKNFLELVSYLYAYEQLQKQKSETRENLKVSLFDKEFMERLELLRNNYVHNISIS